MYKRRGCNIPQEFSLTATTLRECLTCDRARLQGRRHTQIFSIYHQLSLCSHSQRLESSFYFFSPSFPGSSSSSRPFQFLSEEFFGFPILLHSLQVTQPTHPLPFYPFYYIFSFTQFFQFSISRTFPFPIFIFRTTYSSKYFPFKNKQSFFFLKINT